MIFWTKHLTSLLTWKTENWVMFNLYVIIGRIIWWWTSWCPHTKARRELNQPELWQWSKPTREYLFYLINDTISFSNRSYRYNPIKDTKKKSHYHYYHTLIWHAKIAPDMNFPDVSCCQNNWEETPEMIQDGLCLMGFDDDKNCDTRKPCQICEFRLSKTTRSVKKEYAEMLKVEANQ